MNQNAHTTPTGQADSSQQSQTVSCADIEITLHDLLIHFRDSSDQSDEQVMRVAREGAKALLTQMENGVWLDVAQSAASLASAKLWYVSGLNSGRSQQFAVLTVSHRFIDVI